MDSSDARPADFESTTSPRTCAPSLRNHEAIGDQRLVQRSGEYVALRIEIGRERLVDPDGDQHSGFESGAIGVEARVQAGGTLVAVLVPPPGNFLGRRERPGEEQAPEPELQRVPASARNVERSNGVTAGGSGGILTRATYWGPGSLRSGLTTRSGFDDAPARLNADGFSRVSRVLCQNPGEHPALLRESAVAPTGPARNSKAPHAQWAESVDRPLSGGTERASAISTG